jgi:tetratricopeptide (TPR) repeat protein
MDEQVQKIEVAAKKSWTVIAAWIAGISAVIGFIGTIGGGVTWFKNRHRQSSEYKAKVALAETQASQKQYQAALRTYQDLLKGDPTDSSVLNAQMDTAMLWVENFSVSVREGKDEGDLSSPALDEIFPVLSSGLGRTKGPRAADVKAHLGWAHFLNEKIAHREDDSVAVDDWHAALSNDPNNVYAHSMLGNWLLQSGGSLNEAIAHFQTAVGAGRSRPFVRRWQIGGLLDLEVPGARAEMMRVANQMRGAEEPLDSRLRQRMSSWCFDPVTNHAKLVEALGAVPFDDAWKTYLWLSETPANESEDEQNLKKSFIHANLLEIAGSRDAALAEYRQIRKKLESRPGSLRDQVEAGIKRLTRT